MGADGRAPTSTQKFTSPTRPTNSRTTTAWRYGSGVNECSIYLSDEPNAPLVAVEDVIDAATFESLSADEQTFWHSNDEEAANGSEPVLPDASEEQIQAFQQSMGGTYGKLVRLWNLQDGLPLGQPEVIYPVGTGQ